MLPMYGFVLILGAAFLGGAICAQEEAIDYSEELANLVAEMNELQGAIDQSSNTIAELHSKINQINDAMANRSENVGSNREKIIEVELEIVAIEDNQADVNDRILALKKMVASHLHSLYRKKKRHWLKNFIDAGKQQAAITRKYYQYFTLASLTAIRELEINEELLQQKRETKQKERTLLENQMASNTGSRSQQEWDVREYRSQIRALENLINGKQRQLNTLIREREDLERLVATSSNSTLQEGGETGSDDRRIWPIKSEIERNFGDDRAEGRLTWDGILFKSTAADVVAVAAGRVVYADRLTGYGTLVMIDHGDELLTLYGNCDSSTIASGDLVEAGEVIARTEEHGADSNKGLYFEVRQNGKAVDPASLLEPP